MTHVMIDLETLGLNEDAAFISLGACVFDPETGAIADTFYMRVDWNSALCAGRTITASTLQWWLAQEDAARLEVVKPGEPLLQVLQRFREWLPEAPAVWGNGATFDISILNHAYAGSPPWSYRAPRDMRTILDVADGMFDRPVFDGVAHNALDDAVYQAKVVSAAWRALRSGRAA